MIAARRPIRQMSEKRLQWSKWIATNYAKADRRANGKCEGCGKVGSRLEHHHIAGRSEGEPYASVAELLAVLCAQCHRSVTGVIGGGINASLHMRLARQAVVRLRDRYGTPETSLLDALKSLKASWIWVAETNRLEAR